MASSEKPISLIISESQVIPGQELHGRINISYGGRFDSLVINSQIEKSSDVFSYVMLNGKKINHPYARLSIFRTELGGANPVEFTAVTKHVPAADYSSVKFRVSIIQEHKEVVSDVANVRIVRA
jgi:hypothetical protein